MSLVMFFQTPTTPTPPETTPTPPSVDVGLLTATRQIAQSSRYSRLNFSVPEDTTYAAEYVAPHDCTSLSLVYSAIDSTSGQTATIGAAVVVGGKLHQAKFGTNARATVIAAATPEGRWATATVDVTLPAGTTFVVHTFVEAGGFVMRGAAAQGGPITATPGDRTVPGSDPIPMTSPHITEAIVGPVAIIGKTRPSTLAVAGLGDSIMEGGADANYGKGAGGFFYRALRVAGVPGTNFGIWADDFTRDPSVDRRYGGLLPNYTHAVCEYGTNALTGVVVHSGGDWKDLGRSAIRFWTWVAGFGVKLAQTTLTPKVKSTDGYTTVDGMSPSGAATEAVRKAYNAWVMDRAPMISGAPVDPGTAEALRAGDTGHPLVDIIDTNAAVAATNSRGEEVFDVDPGGVKLTADEAHPSPAGHARMAVPVRQWIESLSA